MFARSLRIGVESPYGSLGFIPLPERYFVGGSNSHRGFAINQAGPRDPFSGAPLGGNAMIVNNIELRLPPAPLPYVGDNLSFVLFHDMGNAFGTANEMWKNLCAIQPARSAELPRHQRSGNLRLQLYVAGGGNRSSLPDADWAGARGPGL